ncbi:hypothetical protein BC938DRAFT_478867, partial [Jimgerdemannia flammicorona]
MLIQIMSTSDTQHLNLGDQASSVVANQEPPRPLRRSRRIAQAREHAASLQWKATTDDMHCFERRKTNKGTCERDDRTAKKKTSQGVVSPMLALRDSPLGRLPIDVLLYFLEALDGHLRDIAHIPYHAFTGPSLAQMESTCRQLNLFISRYQRTLYRGLFHSFAYQYELEGIDMRVHAPLWLGKSKQLLQQRMTTNGGTGNWSEDKVCDWKIQFAETYVYYVGMRCSVCLCNLEVGMSYYAWEVDMCKYCAVRNLINKGSLRAFGLTEADVKQLAGVKPRRIKRIASGGLIDDVERRKRKAAEAAAAEQLRRKEVDTMLKKKGLRVTDLDSIWFPKALKHEFEEVGDAAGTWCLPKAHRSAVYITGKTDPALKRQRTRQRRQLTLATDTSTAIPTAISTTPASDRQPISLDKTKKNLKRTISTLADDAEEYIPKKKRYAAITRAIKKAGYDFERDVKTTFDGHLALWKVKDYLALDDSPSRTDAYIAKLEDTTSVSREVIRILDYERGFRDTMLKTFQSKEARELECIYSDLLRNETWLMHTHSAGHAFVRYLVVRTEDHFEDAGTKRRRERLETYLQGTIDWYFTDLRDSIEKIRVKHFKVCERTYWRDHGDQFYTCELHTDLTAMARVFDDHVRGYSRQDSTNGVYIVSPFFNWHYAEDLDHYSVGMRILRHQRIVTKTRALRRRIFDATDELRSATPQTQTLKSPKASVAFDSALYS